MQGHSHSVTLHPFLTNKRACVGTRGRRRRRRLTRQDGLSELVAVVGGSVAGLDGHLQRRGEAGRVLPALPRALPGKAVAWGGGTKRKTFMEGRIYTYRVSILFYFFSRVLVFVEVSHIAETA